MAELTVPRLDFSSIAQLPQVYRDARTRSIREQTLADLGQGNVDYNTAASNLLRAGDFEGGLSLAKLGVSQQSAQASANGVYGTPIYGTDANGRTVLGAIGKSGQFVPIDTGGVTVNPGIKTVDTGTGVVVIDSRTGRPISGGAPQGGVQPSPQTGAPPMSITPQPSGVMQAGQPTQSQPAPQASGYIPKDVQGEAYLKKAGAERAERDVALPEKRGKAEAALNDIKRQWSVVGTDIDRAITQIDSGIIPRTGLFSVAQSIPGSPQHDLANLLNTIKTNIGFDKLQSMRNNSPTGGALGNVSDNENKLLQAVNGAIEQSQSGAQLKVNLRRIKGLMQEVRMERERAFNRDFGNVAPAQSQPQNQPVRVNSPDEARRLPSGTPITLPDGSTGRVP